MIGAAVLLLAASGHAIPQASPPRLRTLLENGAAIYAERMPGSGRVSLQLFLGARPAPESPLRHGQRHLLEHMLARGEDGTLDRRLEALGGFLRAETARDWMRFEVSLPVGQVKLGVDVLREILRGRGLTETILTQEREAIVTELAWTETPSIFGRAAWRALYGDAGLDPNGYGADVAQVDLATLRNLAQRLTSPENLTVVVTGEIDVDRATADLRDLLEGRKAEITDPVSSAPRAPLEGRATGLEVEAPGEALAAAVPGMPTPKTVHVLAAALLLAANTESSWVLVTPSTEAGVVTVGAPAGIMEAADTLDVGREIVRARVLIRRWLERQRATPEGAGRLRGALLSGLRSARVESLDEVISAMSAADLGRGLSALRAPDGLVLRGGRG